MKKIIASICLLLLTFSAVAQTQTEIDKAMKDLQDVMKDLPPEAKEQVTKIMGQQSTNINDLKKSAPKEANKPSELGTKISKIIGPEGGDLKSVNGKITLKFPAGALSKKTEISIEEIENDLETGSGNAFQLLPEGLQFGQPVKLTLKYTDEDIEGSDENELNIVTQDNNGDWFLNMTSTTDTIKHTTSAYIKHFSKWGVGAASKLKLVPKKSILSKGQFVNLSVEGWSTTPKQLDKNNPDYKKLIQEQKNYSNFLDARNEVMLTQTIKKINDLKTKLHININEGDGDDDLIPLEDPKKGELDYSVINWTMNNATAPISNSSGSLSPQGFNAKYTAPKIIPVNKTITVSVNLKGLVAKGKIIKIKLIAKIDLIDEGYLNYTVDGKETKTLQFAYSSEYQKLAKEEGDKVAERTTALCFYSKEENTLSIGTNVMLPFLDKQILIGFSVKNPGKKQHLINCDGDGGISVTLGAKSLGILNDPCTNTEKYRYNDGKGCSTRDICKTFELTLTEFDGTDGGTVAGNFSGTVYEDGDEFKKGCNSSKPHFITGDFSLIIKTEEEGKKYESLLNGKPKKEKFEEDPDYQKSKEQLDQIYDKTPAQKGENYDPNDVPPLVKPKPTPKPKPKKQEVKPFE